MKSRNLTADLKRQLDYLGRSCALFDELQFEDEAIRMATVLRTIFHQTKNSTSLLTYMGSPRLSFPSYISLDFPSEKTVFFQGLSAAKITYSKKAKLVPLLGDGPPIIVQLPFEKWWNQIVWVSNELKLTRKQLVLFAANKDGGTHIDKLPKNYAKFINDGGFLEIPVGTIGNNTICTYSFKNTHHSSLRQISWEVMNCQKLLEMASIT